MVYLAGLAVKRQEYVVHKADVIVLAELLDDAGDLAFSGSALALALAEMGE